MPSIPIHVLLDSNSLRSAFMGEGSIAFRTLSGLAARGKILIHLSDVVLQEVRTQIGGRIQECGIDKAKACFKELRKLTPSHQRLALDEVERAFDLHATRLAESIDAQITIWLTTSKVVVHAVQPEHTTKVFEAYFAGAVPFKAVKSREDFPDAFIWQVVCDLARSKPVHFVCNDAKLSSCCSQLAPALTVHTHIGNLLQSGCLPIKATQDDLNLAHKCEGVINEIQQETRSILYSALERVRFNAASTVPLAVDGLLQVKSVLGVAEPKIDSGSIVPIGDSFLLARFSASATARASYELSGGLPGTFNLLETTSVLADFDLALTGSLLLKPVFGTTTKDSSARAVLDNIRVELDEVGVTSCKPHLSGIGTEPKHFDSTPVRILISDEERLTRALAQCMGLVLITGRRKRQRVRAAESLLFEVTSRHPAKLLVSTYKTPSFLQMGCRALPGIGESASSRRPPLSDDALWDRLMVLDPDGIVVDTVDSDDFESADKVVRGRKLLILGITNFKNIEECRGEFSPRTPDPAAIVEAS